ncbi:MAG TPA: VTT domain-containing protein, partial [Pyrinomonadaceae bacterium]|nr:VTT domain-containing protein [Pyrinomonadaceae bacterium]
MTFFWQIIEKRRWLWAFGVFAFLFAAYYFGANLVQSDNFAVLKSGIFAPQNIKVEEFSTAALFLIFASATLISEDLACIGAGVLASQGKISLALAVSSCAFGIFIGDILLFIAGRFLGRKALKIKFINFFISENAFEKSSHWLERRGMKTVFISRFIFGLRLPLYFAAGVLKTSFWRFTLYFSIAVAIWTPILVGATFWLGAGIVKNSLFNQNLWLAFILLIAGLLFVVRVLQQLLTWKGRRIFWGKIKRRFIWEFWSLRVFYVPVVFYIARLAVKHRSLTVFTCANPAILASGFVGESKEEILQGLRRSEAAQTFLLKHTFLSKAFSAGEKQKIAGDFMTENALSFPIVLKPDVGERGFGVQIVKTFEELEEKLSVSDEDLILQEFCGGEETSVFYYRYPRAEKGEIFAITEKRFPRVTGDGSSTLEELILRDNRAICLAKKYLERNAGRLETIPESGAEVQIIDIGTHSRGAIFLDGGWMKTEALEEKIDEICRGFSGFYFGRFDIRCKSFEEFSRAENFKIVELNGVTSEATSIYDPKNSLFDAYKILFEQWKIAFEIGA